MTSSSQEQSRSERLREYEKALEHAAKVVTVMGAVVRAREARGRHGSQPPEIAFAAQGGDDGRALPAAVFVALRRDDTATVIEALLDISDEVFLIARREEMGEGYRLQMVDETRILPDVELLLSQLSALLDIPADVLAVLGHWGIDDPRTAGEVNALLDSRFGASGAPPVAATPATPAAEARSDSPAATAGLTMSVQETADVLQLTEAQAKVLATLVRRAGVTITP
ncbi:MAG: hypothetical protein ACRDWT_02705 [Jatrophihabitantaceae bacterium]